MRKREPVSPSGLGQIVTALQDRQYRSTGSTGCTGCGPGGRVNAVDPAYAVDLGPWGVPDPPRKPYPPRYFPARRISGHLGLALPAGNTPGSRRPPARITPRGKKGVAIHDDVIMSERGKFPSGQAMPTSLHNRY